MRGATAPRLILELIASRIVIADSDKSDQGLVSRIERLERQAGMEPMPTRTAATKAPTVKAAPVKQTTEAPKAKSEEVKPAEVKDVKPSGNMDVTSLRRLWPDVIENVKKKRRLTWSLLSASAQILAVDDKIITIGIVNAGARDSFLRSDSEPILSDAFVEVTGVRRKIEVIVDPSVDPYSPANMAKRIDEDPTDPNQLQGTELIMKELGAQVIAESDK
jgi:DNA polymerase-3 subunit gamma/tau